MNILIFEYITGGGFNKKDLPPSLLNEGQAMLNALLDNMRQLPQLTISLMLDNRAQTLINSQHINTIIIDNTQNSLQVFTDLVSINEAVWIIAPEFDNILENLCKIVSDSGKILLNSPANAVAITANKWLTYLQLKKQRINTVETALLNTNPLPPAIKNAKEWVIKPIDGVGCSETYIINKITPLSNNKTIIQPHILGKKTSLSALFKQSKAWLLCVNQQNFEIINNSYQLTAISVNSHAKSENYQQLLESIAIAFADLWGYVGIDLIETDTQILVLEINPRLTSSFIGIEKATGINTAAQVINLLHSEPVLTATRNQKITIKL
jgi:predicted ATP-grasp superfamily ATP-dependent carboligase